MRSASAPSLLLFLLAAAIRHPGDGWGLESAAPAVAIDLGACAVQLYPGESRHAVDVPFRIPDGMAFVVGPPQASSWSWLEAEIATVAPRNPLPPGSRQILHVSVSASDQGTAWTGVARVDGTVAGAPAAIIISVTATVADYIEWPQPDIGALIDVDDGGPPAIRTVLIHRGHHAEPFDAIQVDTDRPDAVTVAVTSIDANTWQLRETVAARGLSGVIMVRETMRFTHAGLPCPYLSRRTVRIRAHGALNAKPAAILFGACDLAESMPRTVRLLGSDTAVAVRTTDPEQVSCQVQAHGDGQELVATFTARVDAGCKGAAYPGYCIVTLGRGGELLIPYYAAILPHFLPPPTPVPPARDPDGF